MSITIDKAAAAQVFLDAIALVDSGFDLPEEWVSRTVSISESPSKTFIAMLGTALVSRATDERVDPLVLKASADPAPGLHSYSARSVATEVLAPMASEHSIDIGTKGREPLNNQPFFRYDRVHEDMVVKNNARPYLLILIEALHRIRQLGADELLPALAAFVAVRRAAVRKPAPRILIASTAWSLIEFVRAVGDFVRSWPEDGKRGQALAAAALDLAFAHVRLGHAYDPSRHIPGDVFAFGELHGDSEPVPVEVKQKHVTAADITSWAAALAAVGVNRGMYLALAPSQPELRFKELTASVLAERDVVLSLYSSVEDFLLAAIVWSTLDPEAFMGAFAATMHGRLQEAYVNPVTVEEWARYFRRG